MRGDEIWNELLVQVFLLVDLVEFLLQLHEHVKLGLAHEFQYGVAGVLRCHLQSPADMSCHQLTEVFIITHGFVLLRCAVVQKQVVADARADGGFFHFRVLVDFPVDLDKRMVVGVEVLADAGLQASGSGTFLTESLVLSLHAVHIGRWTSQVADVAFEVLHLGHFLHLF